MLPHTRMRAHDARKRSRRHMHPQPHLPPHKHIHTVQPLAGLNPFTHAEPVQRAHIPTPTHSPHREKGGGTGGEKGEREWGSEVYLLRLDLCNVRSSSAPNLSPPSIALIAIQVAFVSAQRSTSTSTTSEEKSQLSSYTESLMANIPLVFAMHKKLSPSLTVTCPRWGMI